MVNNGSSWLAGNNHAEEVSFDGSVENLGLFDLSLTLGRPTQYSLVLLCVSQHRLLNAIGHKQAPLKKFNCHH